MRISDWSSDVCSSDLGEKNGHAYVEHNGEAVGFLSENIVFPDDKAAVVVFVNSDFSNAFLTITQGIVKTAFPAIANAATGTDETVKTAEARKVYYQLVTGTHERAPMTGDANSYFTAEAQRDSQTSLSALDEPASIQPSGPPKLRARFVHSATRE